MNINSIGDLADYMLQAKSEMECKKREYEKVLRLGYAKILQRVDLRELFEDQYDPVRNEADRLRNEHQQACENLVSDLENEGIERVDSCENVEDIVSEDTFSDNGDRARDFDEFESDNNDDSAYNNDDFVAVPVAELIAGGIIVDCSVIIRGDVSKRIFIFFHISIFN